MTKYIVSGYIGFDNFGDEAIAKVLVDRLKKDDAEKITLISSNPEKTAKIHQVNSCQMLNFWKDLREADILISGGGSLLQDVTSVKSLIYYLGVIYSALILGKKVEIFAQGIGPINSKIGQILTRIALKFARKISVRDKKSQEFLTKWNIKSELVNDPILDLEIPNKNKKGVVGIQLRAYPTLTDKFLNNLADEIVKHFSSKRVQLISLQDSIDLEVCEKFAHYLRIKGFDGDIEILNNLSINQVFECISNLEYLVAMRFHANVVGLKAGIKTLAINYDIKVKKLAEQYNLPLIELKQNDMDKEFNQFLALNRTN